MRVEELQRLLVVLANGQRAGIPLACVREIMRPLPLTPVAGAPECVLGVALIRGESVPVVELGSLLGGEKTQPARFVALAVDGRSVALGVSEVAGVSALPAGSLARLPPLLEDDGDGVIAALSSRDSELLFVLRAARLLPELPAVTDEVAP